jgi:superfamily II DNA or RNA helicase
MPELAYIDPGTGSLIIQAVIAMAIAVPLFFRQQIGRILRVVRRRGAPEESYTSVDDGARGR